MHKLYMVGILGLNSLALHVRLSLFKVYPERQEQVNEPGVLVHSCPQL